MKPIVPEGWQEVKKGTPVYFHDLEWDRSKRLWTLAKNFGDSNRKCRGLYIRQNTPDNKLFHAIRQWPHPGWMRCTDKAARLANLLWMAGVETVEPGHGFLAGKKEHDHILLHEMSIETTPYISFPFTTSCFGLTRPFLWWLLDRAGMGFSGGASDEKNYVQAAWYDKEGFLSKVVLNFMLLKKLFKKHSPK